MDVCPACFKTKLPSGCKVAQRCVDGKDEGEEFPVPKKKAAAKKGKAKGGGGATKAIGKKK